MKLSTRFFLLLFFILTGVYLTVWFGVRPQYERALVSERITLISEHQRERIEAADNQFRLWQSMLAELGRLLAETADITLTQDLFQGYSAIMPELLAMRIVEANSGEYLEIRSADYRQSDVFSSMIAKVDESDSGFGWDIDRAVIMFSIDVRIGSDSFILYAIFDAIPIERYFFDLELGTPFQAVFRIGNQQFSKTEIPEFEVQSGPVTRVDSFTGNGEERVVISTPSSIFAGTHSLFIASDAIREPVRRIFLYSLWVISAAFLVLMLASVVLIRRLYSPLRRFLTDLKPFSRLDFTHPFSEVSVPELQALSQQMEEIREKLLHYQRINVERIIENQQRLNFLMQYASDPIGLFNREGTFTFTNDELVKLYQDLKVSPPVSIEDILKPDEIEVVQENSPRVVRDGPLVVQSRTRELSMRNPAGKVYYYHMQQVELLNEQLQVLGGQILLFDLTRERELDKHRNEMISIIVHEFKNPLSGIRGLVGMLKSGAVPDEEKLEFYTIIERSNDAMFSLVERFLQVSRLESGEIVVDKVPEKMDSLITNVVEDFKTLLNEKKLKIEVRKDTENVVASVSKSLMEDVFRNLISNAIKYGAENRTIVILFSAIDDDLTGKKWLRISVTDHGYGIPEEYRDKIFRKFFRIQKYVNESGTGLGLPYAKEVVRQHEGELTVTSDPEYGSRFIVQIPALDQDR
ncbi:MAG: HAMP domain-containing histidine kinase [Balneolales bacterium]|nr:HAMP domain-containing histidine kinase [Balneolales bacterium]